MQHPATRSEINETYTARSEGGDFISLLGTAEELQIVSVLPVIRQL